MAQRYVMVRLTAETAASLAAIRDGVVRAYQVGQIVSGNMDLADGLSLSAMVQRLIDHVRRDRGRVKKAQQAARARRRAACQQV